MVDPPAGPRPPLLPSPCTGTCSVAFWGGWGGGQGNPRRFPKRPDKYRAPPQLPSSPVLRGSLPSHGDGGGASHSSRVALHPSPSCPQEVSLPAAESDHQRRPSQPGGGWCCQESWGQLPQDVWSAPRREDGEGRCQVLAGAWPPLLWAHTPRAGARGINGTPGTSWGCSAAPRSSGGDLCHSGSSGGQHGPSVFRGSGGSSSVDGSSEAKIRICSVGRLAEK